MQKGAGRRPRPCLVPSGDTSTLLIYDGVFGAVLFERGFGVRTGEEIKLASRHHARGIGLRSERLAADRIAELLDRLGGVRRETLGAVRTAEVVEVVVQH